MKVVILAGGKGTRISEETQTIPKPMVEIGGKPVLWHIMKTYSHYGFNEFVICLGYRGYMVKEYFSHYFLHMSDVTMDLAKNSMHIHTTSSEPWKVTMVDTGQETMTGGRLKKTEKYIGNNPFMMTYGDGLGDVNIPSLIKFHQAHKTIATVTAVQPLGRFGSLDIGGEDKVSSFLEKPKGDFTWISTGFFVLQPEVFKYIEGDGVVWEKEPMEKLSQEGQLVAYRHNGFWRPMDTLRDKNELERLWQSGQSPWKVW
ncbi:MAG: glucose-1-phosphate cytidylyltransferase [Elusimicrobia bacterium]|nr:glucose-1-phosphate cytidylyltransferase [Elusimicrobiota bacterium]